MTFSLTDCDRARESVSAELDGELPELERGRLAAHLHACPDCSAWAAETRGATQMLREAALEAPATPIALPPRGRRWRVGPAVAVSSVAALAASLVVAIAPQNASVGQHLGTAAVSHRMKGLVPSFVRPLGLDSLVPVNATHSTPPRSGRVKPI